jgi:type II secretory pathway pseudopilin PulG
MVALLVGMSIAAVLMTVAMPAWRQMVRREQEAELIFRGQQYVRAIGLFQKQAGPGVLPPNLDTLVNGHFLRKKFKDPITNQDFELLSPTAAAGQPTPGGPAPGAGAGAGAAPGAGRGFQTSGAVVGNPTGGQPGAAPTGGRGALGGIIGVASKSKAASIKIYNGRTHYNEWQFVFVAQTQAPGSAVPGQVPGQRGGGPGVGGNPQRGTPPPFGAGGQNTGRQGPGGGRGNAPTFPTGGRGGQPSVPTPQQPTSPFAPRR